MLSDIDPLWNSWPELAAEIPGILFVRSGAEQPLKSIVERLNNDNANTFLAALHDFAKDNSDKLAIIAVQVLKNVAEKPSDAYGVKILAGIKSSPVENARYYLKELKKENNLILQEALSSYPKELEEFKKAKCFIATACYGTSNCVEVFYLQQLRDQYLVTNRLGSFLVSLYYFLSPPIAELISSIPFLREIIKYFVLQPIVFLVWKYASISDSQN